MILMKYHTLFFSKLEQKISQNLSFAAVMIGALRVIRSYDKQNITLEGISYEIDLTRKGLCNKLHMKSLHV